MKKTMNRKILCCVLSLALLAAATITAYADTFSDTQGYWGAGFVEKAYENGIVTGYPDGSFRPEAKVSHQEAMTMICKTVETVLPGKLDMGKGESYRSVLVGLDFDPGWALPFGAALFDAGAAYAEDFSDTAKKPATRQTIGAWMVRSLGLPMAPLCEIDTYTDMSSVSPRFVGEASALKR